MQNLVRVSRADSLPFRKATFYKWLHLGRHPEIFVRVGRNVFIDLVALDRLFENGRLRGKIHDRG